MYIAEIVETHCDVELDGDRSGMKTDGNIWFLDDSGDVGPSAAK